jgi:hypothetical protein
MQLKIGVLAVQGLEASVSVMVPYSNDNQLLRMAPNLAESQLAEIRDMILSKSPNVVQMAKVAGYRDPLVRAMRSNLGYFGSTKALRTVSDALEGYTSDVICSV